MSKQLHLVALIGLLALSPLMTVGCGGVECGPNTTEKNGQCVPAYAKVCADGTSLNPDTGKCELDSPPVDCGAGTELQDGSCVVVAAACGDNAQLDANSSKCVPTDTVCGDGLAFTDGKCMPTDQVCDGGTVFSQSTGTCMPEATCQAGDVVLNGNCVRPAQKLAADADVTSSENDDPSMGGTANAMTLTDGQQTVFTGNVDAPADLDGDGVADQDVDVFSFEATAGQIFTVSVQPVDGTSMGFVVSDESGHFMRYSDAGFASGSARKVLIPRDGTYYIAVAPAAYLASDGNFAATGEDGWSYVGTIEQADPLSATDVDTSSADVAGQMLDITDNWFKLTNLTNGDAVKITPTVADGATGVLEIWSSATDFVQTLPLQSGQEVSAVLPTGDVYFFVDWTRRLGNDTTFDLGVQTVPGENLGDVPAGGTVSSTDTTLAGDGNALYAVTAAPGEVIEIAQHNDQDSGIDVSVTAPDGTLLLDSDYLSTTNDYAYAYAPNGGTFTISVTNSSSSDSANFGLTVNSVTPTDEGDVAAGDQISVDESSDIAEGRQVFYRVSFTADVRIMGTLSGNGNDVDAMVYDAATGQVIQTYSDVGDETITADVPAGVYLFSPLAYDELTSGFSLNLDVTKPPVQEVESNDTVADAQDLGPMPAAATGQGDNLGTNLDYFKFTVTDAMAVEVSLTASGTDAFCGAVALHDASDNIIAASDVDFLNYVGTVAAVLAPGDYYAVATGSCSSTSGSYDYQLSIRGLTDPADTLDAGSNDDFASATDATGGATIAGTVTSDTDVDWYRFQVASAMNASVKVAELADFGAPGASLTVEVYDSSQTLMGTSSDTLSFDASTDYYLKVSGFDATGKGNSYMLSFEAVVCGDGAITGAETCEDGNTADGDGCSSKCVIEPSGLDIPASGSSVMIGGTLDASDPTYDRPYTDCTANGYDTVPYDTFTIVNNTGSAQTLAITPSWGAIDGVVHVFSDPFDPNSPTVNCVDGTFYSLSSVSIAAGQTLVIVAETSSDSSAMGPYTIDVATN